MTLVTMAGLLDVGFMLAALSIFFFLRTILVVQKKPIFDTYRQPETWYWCKVFFMYIILSYRQIIQKWSKSPKICAELDRIQPLSKNDKAVDAVYFATANCNKEYLVIASARRKYGLVDGFFYLKLQNLPMLGSPKLPDTTLHQPKDDIEDEYYGAEGIKIVPIEPMKKWQISYEGQLKNIQNESKIYQVKMEAEFVSDLPYFNMDTELNPWAMAKAMALEHWSSDYFTHIKKIHQTHYEQHGDIKGTITIDDQSYLLSMNGLRDHSFGKRRDWKLFHRYVFHFITTENGDRISVGVISMPGAFSCLTVGYVYTSKEKANESIESTDFKMYQHGEMGNPPNDYAFSIKAGQEIFTIQVNIIDKPSFFISKEWETKIYEMTATFQVNGVNAWGITEWAYKNVTGR